MLFPNGVSCFPAFQEAPGVAAGTDSVAVVAEAPDATVGGVMV